jgi:hypothetical protein
MEVGNLLIEAGDLLIEVGDLLIEVGDLSLKGRVGDSRLVPCLWTEITYQNVRNTNYHH